MKADPEKLSSRKARNRKNGITYYQAHTEDLLSRNLLWRQGNVAKCLWREARRRSLQKGVPFTLRPEDIIVPDVCPVLGTPFRLGSGCSLDESPTLDRLRPELGYTKENVQVISYKANRIKNNATLEDMAHLVDFYTNPLQVCVEVHPDQEVLRKRLWSRRRREARGRGLEFNLTLDDLLVPLCCPVLGIPLIPNSKSGPCANSPTVDRIDNTQGYVPDNIVVVSSKANRMKNNGNLAELKQVLLWMKQTLGAYAQP